MPISDIWFWKLNKDQIGIYISPNNLYKNIMCNQWDDWRAMDPNYYYKISWSLTRLIVKLAGQTHKSTFFSAVDNISLYYIVSLISPIWSFKKCSCKTEWHQGFAQLLQGHENTQILSNDCVFLWQDTGYLLWSNIGQTSQKPRRHFVRPFGKQFLDDQYKRACQKIGISIE